MGDSLKDRLSRIEINPDVKKIYVPDTNILIEEYFSPIILSGNPPPDPETK